MLAMAQRDQQPLSVVIIDLDHFKTVNDALGHAAGDQLLADFGELLDAQCRKSDVACRYGGEEFCLLMPRTQAQAARRKSLVPAEAMVGTAQWRAAPSCRAQARFSAGIADSQGVRRRRVPVLLKAADDALLQAKRLGRNRVLVHDDGSRAAA